MVEFPIRVTPKSSRNKIEWGETIKVWVTAPPVDGEANDAVCALLAKALKIPKTSVSVCRGHSGRDKVIRCEGIEELELSKLVDQPKLM